MSCVSLLSHILAMNHFSPPFSHFSHSPPAAFVLIAGVLQENQKKKNEKGKASDPVQPSLPFSQSSESTVQVEMLKFLMSGD